MGKDLKERLKDEMQKRKIKVPKLSEETDIPKDRIYAWYRDNSTPKAEDAKKLESWINGETSNNSETSAADPGAPYATFPNKSTLETYLEIINKQADTIKSQQETIFILTDRGNVGGRPASSV